MTFTPITPITPNAIASVVDVLRAGKAVVLPCPSPLPYVVAAANPTRLNRAKARAASQPCGVLVSPDGAAFSHLSLTDAARDFAEWAASVELVNLLAPVKDTAPGWLRSAAVQGYVGLSMAWHPRLLALAVEFDHLYVSSANQTSQPAAVTAREAEAAFAGRLLVLDGDRFRDQTREHGSAMMLQIHRTGEARVVRHGVQDRWCPDPVTYVRWLRSRYRSST